MSEKKIDGILPSEMAAKLTCRDIHGFHAVLEQFKAAMRDDEGGAVLAKIMVAIGHAEGTPNTEETADAFSAGMSAGLQTMEFFADSIHLLLHLKDIGNLDQMKAEHPELMKAVIEQAKQDGTLC